MIIHLIAWKLISVITTLIIIASLTLLICNNKSQRIHLCNIFVFLILFIIYQQHGSVGSDAIWALRIRESYAGKSSCTNNILSAISYNPNGLLSYTDSGDINDNLVYCPFSELKWADATNTDFIGTDIEYALLDADIEPCVSCDVASTRKNAYAMNLGKGLTHGFEIGASIIDVSLCPGVDRKITVTGDLGVGRKICTTCSLKFQEKGLIAGYENCKPSESDDLLCVFCPGWIVTESNNVGDIRAVAGWLLFWLLLVTVHTIYNECISQKSKMRCFRRQL